MSPNLGYNMWRRVDRNGGQVAAWTGAALFFGYKIVSGYFIIDLSLKMECERRQVGDSDQDHLGVMVTAKKGERSAIELHDARVTVFDYSTGRKIHDSQRFKGSRRLTFASGNDGYKEVNSEKLSSDNSLLNFAPGDEMQFAAMFVVGHAQVVTVEAVILGRKKFRLPDKFGEWRATRVSLPLEPKTKP
jgi:hypothetical protein